MLGNICKPAVSPKDLIPSDALVISMELGKRFTGVEELMRRRRRISFPTLKGGLWAEAKSALIL